MISCKYLQYENSPFEDWNLPLEVDASWKYGGSCLMTCSSCVGYTHRRHRRRHRRRRRRRCRRRYQWGVWWDWSTMHPWVALCPLHETRRGAAACRRILWEGGEKREDANKGRGESDGRSEQERPRKKGDKGAKRLRSDRNERGSGRMGHCFFTSRVPCYDDTAGER